jgi:hypothetical protein
MELKTERDCRRVLEYLQVNFGAYSLSRDVVNRNACTAIDNFSTVTQAKSGMLKYKLLMQERQSWTKLNERTGVMDNYEVTEVENRLWLLTKLDTPLFRDLIRRIKDLHMNFQDMKDYLNSTIQDIKERTELTTTSRNHNPDEGTYIPEFMDQLVPSRLVMSAKGTDKVDIRNNYDNPIVKVNESSSTRLCFVCNSPMHVARNCPSTLVRGYDGSRPFHPSVNKRLPSGRGGLVQQVPFRKPFYSPRNNRGNNDEGSQARSYYGPSTQTSSKNPLLMGVKERARTASMAGFDNDEDQVLAHLDVQYKTMRNQILNRDRSIAAPSILENVFGREYDAESTQVSMITDRESESSYVDNAPYDVSVHYDFGHDE